MPNDEALLKITDVYKRFPVKKRTLYAVSGVSLSLARGESLGLVGESGCGKSTLAKLLSQRESGYPGSLTLGGTEISEASSSALRPLITVVSYESYLFEGTIADLLRMGKADATEKEMQEALEHVALWDFVKAQGGLSFEITERGSNLSGGQRQRLALARAFLKDSPIYIFDEATSNIDRESEDAILKAILSMRGSHTILLISHRLQNVTNADGILFMQAGQSRELGTHEELMNLNGGYASLYRAQRALEHLGEEPFSVCDPKEEEN